MTDPVASVEGWLAKEGYPLEYEVARTLQTAGFRTWQGIHYRDTEGTEQRTREIDVLAAEWPEEAVHRPNVELIVEVKHSHEPWLILTTDLPIEPPYLYPDLLVTDKASDPIRTLLRTPPVPGLLTIPDRHGFNVVQTIRDRDHTRVNPAYVALTNVVKAAHAQWSVMKSDGRGIFLPVIVVGGALVQLGYDANGDRILEPVLWQRIRWQGSSVVDHGVLVDIVQKDHLPIWAANARTSTKAIADLLEAWVTPGALVQKREA